MKIYELLPHLFTSSEIMVLDFNQIPLNLPEYKNIKIFFNKSQHQGLNPRLPQNRQNFNNDFLQKSGKKYLISRYAEDRIEMLKGSKIAEEGRTIHLGIDIFSQDLERVYAPCDAEIISTGKEEGGHSFGHYLILKPDPGVTKNYIFLGHLSKELPKLGNVTKGQLIAKLGDYLNEENGGWSRHLHLQLLADIPNDNSLPPGYSSKDRLGQNLIKYPDPSFLVFTN